MRRFLSPASLGLLLVGAELATRGVSLTVGRVLSGFSAIANGLTIPVPTVRFLSGVLLLGVGLGGTALGWWLGRVEAKASLVADRCPSCGGVTHRVKRTGYHRAVSAMVGQQLTRRLCDECGWVGLSMRY